MASWGVVAGFSVSSLAKCELVMQMSCKLLFKLYHRKGVQLLFLIGRMPMKASA